MRAFRKLRRAWRLARLLETAGVIRRSAPFVGIDGGPAHLADAVGTPGLILLGRDRRWPEYTPDTGRYADPAFATLLRHDGPVAGLPVGACLEAFDERIGRLGRRMPSGAFPTALREEERCP